jgi:hypothetical protein
METNMNAKRQQNSDRKDTSDEYDIFTKSLRKVLSVPHAEIKATRDAEKNRKASSHVSRAKD